MLKYFYSRATMNLVVVVAVAVVVGAIEPFKITANYIFRTWRCKQNRQSKGLKLHEILLIISAASPFHVVRSMI